MGRPPILHTGATKQLKAIGDKELEKFQDQAWVCKNLDSQMPAASVWNISGLSRVTDWKTDCTKCHNLVFQWLVIWVNQGYAVFWAKSYTKGEAVLFGLTQEMPGLDVNSVGVTQIALPEGDVNNWMYD